MKKIKIRPMTESDIPDALEISKHIWEGRDYVPKLLNSWVTEKNKNFPIVCLENGKIVAVTNMIKIGNMGWSEGLRVHPEWRERGLATMMAKHLIENYPFKDITTIAYLTNANNKKIIHIAEKMNFKELFRCTMINIWGEDEKENGQDIFLEITPKLTLMHEFSVSGYFLTCFKVNPLDENAFEYLQKEKWFLSTDNSILIIYEVNNPETSLKRIFASVNSNSKITNQKMNTIFNFCRSLLQNKEQKISISIPNAILTDRIKDQLIKSTGASEQIGFILSVKN